MSPRNVMNGTERYTKALLREVGAELISATMHLVDGELIFHINSGSGRYRLHKLPEVPVLRLVPKDEDRGAISACD